MRDPYMALGGGSFVPAMFLENFRVRYYRGKVSNFNQSEARKHCFLASDWLTFENLPRKYRTL